LDPEAIQRVREEAWPDATNADELHDAMLWLTFLTTEEVNRQSGWQDLIDSLAVQKRVTKVTAASAAGQRHGVWVTAERLPLFLPVFGGAHLEPLVSVPEQLRQGVEQGQALVEMSVAASKASARDSTSIANSLGLPRADIDIALAALQAEGFAMRGRFTSSAIGEDEWSEATPARSRTSLHRQAVCALKSSPSKLATFCGFCLSGSVSCPRDAWKALTPWVRYWSLEGFEAPASGPSMRPSGTTRCHSNRNAESRELRWLISARNRLTV